MPGDFFDSNILIYIASEDPGKAERVENLVRGGGNISVQVLNEVANVARRKMRMSWGETRAFLALFRGLLSVQPVTAATHECGLDIGERYRLSVYDSMIVASALECGCDRLWSEDMQHGLVIEREARIINPFRMSPT